MSKPLRPDLQPGMFEVALVLLTILVLVGFILETATSLPNSVSQIIDWVDLVVCAVFFTDFCIQFKRADSKLRYMKWGWIDLVSSIPNLDILRWGRLLRIVRLIRLFRGIRSLHRLIQILFKGRVQSGLVSIGTAAFLILVFSSVGILVCETAPESNIKSAEDAIWWSVTTITTVGYGDRFPVTTEGRVLGMFLMATGIGLFGAFSGVIASMFLGQTKKESDRNEELLRQLGSLERKIEALAERQDSDRRGSESSLQDDDKRR